MANFLMDFLGEFLHKTRGNLTDAASDTASEYLLEKTGDLLSDEDEKLGQQEDIEGIFPSERGEGTNPTNKFWSSKYVFPILGSLLFVAVALVFVSLLGNTLATKPLKIKESINPKCKLDSSNQVDESLLAKYVESIIKDIYKDPATNYPFTEGAIKAEQNDCKVIVTITSSTVNNESIDDSDTLALKEAIEEKISPEKLEYIEIDVKVDYIDLNVSSIPSQKH